MSMTNYMELLATNQPWNLLIFMAVPIVLAETVAISELYLLYTRNYTGPMRTLNRSASILVGLYFTGVFLYLLFAAVIPISKAAAWRGPADVIAVGAYLASVIPLLGIALVDLGILVRNRDAHVRMGLHAALVGLFLVVGHVAMIFGMLDPGVLSSAVANSHGAH
jgi:uncharacterized protein DUF6803